MRRAGPDLRNAAEKASVSHQLSGSCMIGMTVVGKGREYDTRTPLADERDNCIAMPRLHADAGIR